MVTSLNTQPKNVYKNPFTEAGEGLTRVSSFSDLIDWFLWIPVYMEIIVCFGVIGLFAIFYMFIVAFFSDKHY